MQKALKVLVVILLISVPTQVFVSASPNLPNDIVLYYNFDEAGVDTISDLSGHQNDGMVSGNAEWEASQYGNAFILDGRVVAVTAPPSDSLISLEAPMSLGVLFRPLSFPGEWQKMLGMYGLPNDRATGWALEFQNDQFNFVLFGLKNHWGVEMEKDEWINIITVFDGSTVDYYVDGVMAASVEAGGDTTNVTQSPGLFMGTEAGILNTQPVNVEIDEFWISNKAISAGDIRDYTPDSLSPVEPMDKLPITWGMLKK